MLQTGWGALEFGTHRFEQRRPPERKGGLGHHIVKERRQRIRRREHRLCSLRSLISLGPERLRFPDPGQTYLPIRGQQRRTPQEELIVKVVVVVPIQHVIAVKQPPERVRIAIEGGSQRRTV